MFYSKIGTIIAHGLTLLGLMLMSCGILGVAGVMSVERYWPDHTALTLMDEGCLFIGVGVLFGMLSEISSKR